MRTCGRCDRMAVWIVRYSPEHMDEYGPRGVMLRYLPAGYSCDWCRDRWLEDLCDLHGAADAMGLDGRKAW